MDSLRIGDVERESAVAQLGEQYALGRLTKDELDERCDAVWSAKTRGDLAPVFADLPKAHPSGGPAGRPHARGRARARTFPLVPVLIVLGVVTVFTHLPVVLIGLALWFFWVRPRWTSRSCTQRDSASRGSDLWHSRHG